MPDIKLLNIDCMEFMKDCKDKEFDLAIVDPPYGIGDDKLTSGGTWAAKYKLGDADWDIAPTQEYFKELFRISKNQIIWGANNFETLPKSRCFIIWDKIAHLPTMADCEYAWCSFDKNAKICKVLRATQSDNERIHITQKPIKLYKWLLHNYAKEGDKIFDSHGGSMSIAIACHYMNFDLTLCEIDKDYYEAGVKRYNEAIKQQTLFDFNHSTI